MLTVDQAPKFTMPVAVNTAAIKGSFMATFVALPNSQLKRIDEEVAEAKTGIAGFVERVALSVSEVDLPLTLSDTPTVAELTDWPGIGGAMQKAYYKGLWEEQEKN